MDQQKSTTSRRRQIITSLKSKAYRDAFVRQQSAVDIPFQIRGMRELREWSQTELAERLGKAQSVVSRLENPRYGKFTLKTLQEIAAAFDVALLVTFLPFSKLADRATKYSIADVEIPGFEDDTSGRAI